MDIVMPFQQHPKEPIPESTWAVLLVCDELNSTQIRCLHLISIFYVNFSSVSNTLHIYTAMEINAMKLPRDSFRADFNARWSLEQIIQSTQ